MQPYDPILAMRAVDLSMRAGGVQLVQKRSAWLQRVIDRVLRLLTLGKMDRYLSTYVTTIGRKIYVPDGWESWPLESRVEILRHELVHVAQFACYGLVPMAVAYVLFPLPAGLAWCRMRLEREAYEETLRAAYERGGRPACEALRPEITRRFVGPDSLFMWPFRRDTARWRDAALEAIARAGSQVS